MRLSSDNAMKKKNPDDIRIFFVSLGCDKNLVDSSQMIGLLRSEGYELTDDEQEADVAVINTCCFIGDAKKESIDTIISLGERKAEGSLKAIIVCGCLAQRYPDRIKKLLPEVDAIVGTTSIDDIVQALREVLEGKGCTHLNSIDRYVYVKGYAASQGLLHSAYLKIAEGCDKNCTYCIIPKVRGHYRSVPIEDLEADARLLASSGVKELILVAQETTVYGRDLYGRKSLHTLLERLCRIDGIEWIRIMYCYPEEIYDGLIDFIKNEPKICRYLDLPIQHCSDRILKLMGRQTNRQSIEDIIDKLRSRIPGIALRTTLISGFPTESEEEHEELKDFVAKMRFERLGCFAYSREEGTAAAVMKGQVHPSTRKRRMREIMLTQQETAFDTAEGQIGRELDVMIDGYIPEEKMYAGRSYMDAPDVDGYVFVKSSDPDMISGTIVRARIEKARDYDLIAAMIQQDNRR